MASYSYFSILMNESNDKTDKSCIILVRLFDSSVGDCRTRFLDMPIVNMGMAVNLFAALKSSKDYNFQMPWHSCPTPLMS